MKLDIAGKNIWQVVSGDDTRPYDDLCLKFGIVMVGPGYCGDARLPENIQAYKDEGENDWGSYLRQVKKGDIIILRRGRKKILAVGEVVKEYEYSDLLSDVHGWDLQHYISVEWYIPVQPIEFSDTPLAMATLAGVNSDVVIARISAEEFRVYNGVKSDLEKLAIPMKIEIDNVFHALIDYGIRIQDAENISNTIKRIIMLADWYNKNDCEVLEHEIRTFLVIPLLISLGWSEQKIKIEYNNIDVAVFSKPFKGNYKESPKIIIETKRYADGLHYATEAAKNYARQYKDCTLLIATNGCRYKLYEKNGDTFIESGYLNFFDMREHHYLDDNIYGAIQCLIQMSSF